MWRVLVPLLACSLLTCLSFEIVMVARQLCLWDFTVYLWLVSVDKASLISSWPQPIFVWHRTLTVSRSLELFDPAVDSTMILWNVSNWNICCVYTQQIFQTTSEINNTAVSTSDLASLNFMTRTSHSVLVTTEYFTCSNTAFAMQFQKKAHKRIALKNVTVGFKITYFCVISIRSMWHWLYNNNLLSVLYKLKGSTHLPSIVEPYPVTITSAPTYAVELSIGSMTGRMVSETVKSHILMQNIWKGFSYVSFILYQYNVILSKKTQEIPAACSPYLYCLLALVKLI